MARSKSAAWVTIASLAAAAAVALLGAGRPHAGGAGPDIPQALRDRAARDGRVRVIVELNAGGSPHIAEGLLSARGIATQRARLRGAGDRILRSLPPDAIVRRYDTVP